MASQFFRSPAFRRTNHALHRDIGYFVSALILVYSISGLALNHVDDWNPDFILKKTEVHLDKKYEKDKIGPAEVLEISQKVGETKFKVFDFPVTGQMKIYYDQATLHLHLEEMTGVYEQISRRPLFYEVNVLHRNSLKGWKWVSDILSILLIVTTFTGLLILRGKYGFAGRGKWLVLAGFLVPAAGVMAYNWIG
ncbi:MAG: PepSY-associated TM helix domain-containing protein [Bacteroidetes bacterium]|nr:PepSY-associated TM helix domain-containing protein [Bacteroidota bacterium]